MSKSRPKPKSGARSRFAKRLKSSAVWLGGLALVGAIIYGLADTSGITYTERHLAAIDFTSLDNDQRHAALVQANAERCTCGCGMTLAQCVATDMTCPIRTDNITRIRAMVQKALDSGGGS